jgi:Cell Wall Hydrolase
MDPLTLSPQDRDYFIRTLIGETGATDPSSVGVAQVIANRMRATGQSAKDVVLAPGQFEPWATRSKELLSYSPNSDAYKSAAQIVDNVASGKTPDPTGGANQFYAPAAQAQLGRAPPSWDNGKGQQIGAHKFFGGGNQSDPDPFSEYPTAQPAAAPPTPAQGKVSTGLSEFPAALKGAAAPSAKATPAAGEVDPFSEYPTATAPTSGTAIPPPATPSPPPTSAMSDPGGGVEFLNSFPVIGPGLVRAGAAVDALTANAPGSTFSERYGSALSNAENLRQNFSAAHPIASTATDIAGGIVGTAPAIAAAPAAFGVGLPWYAAVGPSALSGAGISAADAYARGGSLSDVARSTELGGAFGGLAPVAGALAGRALSAGADALSGTSAGIQNIVQRMHEIGMTPMQVEAELAHLGPYGTLADVSPAFQMEAAGLASKGGSPTEILAKAMKERQQGADQRISQAVNDTLGPAPDAVQAVNQIEGRKVAASPNASTAKAALDTTMGQATDPHTVLQDMVASRSAAAQPLYDKALQGGSTAPLEKQFEAAFGDASNQVSDAAKALNSAKQQQLLAKAKAAQAGENVYSTSAANREGQAADAAVSQAQRVLEDAQQNQQAIRARLQRAQADGTANAPGAIWNPRIQQFLDDPIVKPAIAQGVRIQRLEALAKGEKFNPSEYAITGTDEKGEPIVGSVPNMRTLNVVKKGLDAMVESTKDPITGRLSEEGRSIDMVRRSFLGELDKANPDYAAARNAWAGPSQVQDAYNQGLGIFTNRSGPSGVNTTPGALASWMKTATDSEKEAAKIGARAAFHQQMSSAADPAAKAAALAGKAANQQKLAAILGPDEAKSLTDQLTRVYEDPVGKAFEKGMGLLKNREGTEGVQDTPKGLQAWLKSASPEEIEAHRAGARQAVEQALTSARNGDYSAARSLFGKSTANREKLDAVFPGASKLFDTIENEMTMRETERGVIGGAHTNRLREIGQRYNLPSGPSAAEIAPTMIGEAFGGGAGALGANLASKGFRSAVSALREASNLRMREQTANALAARGSALSPVLQQIERSFARVPRTSALSSGANALTNTTVRSLPAGVPPYVLPRGGHLSALLGIPSQ